MTRGENPPPSLLLSEGTPALIYWKPMLRPWALAECVPGLCRLEIKTLLVTIPVSVSDAPFRGVGRLLPPPLPSSHCQGRLIERRRPHLEVWDPIALLEGDLEHVQGADVRGQAGEALLAAAAHPHQQGVAPRGLQDAVDPADVGHRILEKHLKRSRGRETPGVSPAGCASLACPPAPAPSLPTRPLGSPGS